MKTIEKFAIGAGIILVLYMVMKDDKSDEKSVEWGIFRVAAVQATAVFYICCANQFPHSHLHSQAS